MGIVNRLFWFFGMCVSGHCGEIRVNVWTVCWDQKSGCCRGVTTGGVLTAFNKKQFVVKWALMILHAYVGTFQPLFYLHCIGGFAISNTNSEKCLIP